VQLVIAALQLVILAFAIVLALWQRRLRNVQREILAASITINEQLEAHRREHAAEAARANRPPPNIEWRCPACGVHGEGHIPDLAAGWEFGCPICGVQTEVTKKAPHVS